MFARESVFQPQIFRSSIAPALNGIIGWKPTLALLIFGVCAAIPSVAEIRVNPSISGAAKYESNPRRTSGAAESDSATGSLLDARLAIDYGSPRGSIQLFPRIVYTFFPDSEDEDLEDNSAYLTGAAERQFRKSRMSANYGYTNLSIRTSEFETADSTSPGGSGGRRIVRDDTQERWYVKPSWVYRFSPANLFSVSSGYDSVSYDEELVSTRFDFDFKDVGLTFQHSFNSRHAVSLQARFSKFDSENREARITNNSETTNLSVIYTYAWSATSNISADLGWAKSKVEVERPNTGPFGLPVLCDSALTICTFENDSTNFVGNISAAKRTETIDYSLAIGQSISPNSNGSEVLRFSVNGRINKKFSERVSGQMGILAFDQSNVGGDNQGFDREYVSGNVRLVYRFARRWSVFTDYRVDLDKQSDASNNRTVRNHLVSIGINFSGDGWRW